MRCAGVAATYGTHGLTSEVATGWLVAYLFFGGGGAGVPPVPSRKK